MTDKQKEFPELDSFFAAARKVSVQPTDQLVERVLDDAMRVQPGFHGGRIARAQPGRMAQLFRVLGGWPAMGGLVTATVVGLWIGVTPPSGLSDSLSQVAQVYLGSDDAAYAIDMLAGSGFDLSEEAL